MRRSALIAWGSAFMDPWLPDCAGCALGLLVVPLPGRAMVIPPSRHAHFGIPDRAFGWEHRSANAPTTKHAELAAIILAVPTGATCKL